MIGILKPAKALSAFALDVSGAVFDALFKARSLSRGALILTYFRLKSRRIVRENLLSGSLREETVFGARFGLRDHAAFSSMVREIFLRQCYWFPADTPRPRILDCGGNIGLATLFFKRVWPECRVTVFEPDPDNFRLLDDNLNAAGLGDVERVQAALAGHPGELVFVRDAGDGEGVNSRLASGHKGAKADVGQSAPPGSIKVRAETLSSRIDGGIDFLKMDIEGAESEVLEELAASGKLALIKCMTVEYHHHHPRGVDALSGFLAVLERGGFGYRLFPGQGSDENEAPQDILVHAWRKRP
jgi:FkbM family methyltransferase